MGCLGIERVYSVLQTAGRNVAHVVVVARTVVAESLEHMQAAVIQKVLEVVQIDSEMLVQRRGKDEIEMAVAAMTSADLGMVPTIVDLDDTCPSLSQCRDDVVKKRR